MQKAEHFRKAQSGLDESRQRVLGIERVACSESLCRRGHQLHQPHRAFV